MYKIEKNGAKFNVIEVATETKIRTNITYDEAQRAVRKLKTGVGFNGHTPKFFEHGLPNTK